jgi:hypothetical protein
MKRPLVYMLAFCASAAVQAEPEMTIINDQSQPVPVVVTNPSGPVQVEVTNPVGIDLSAHVELVATVSQETACTRDRAFHRLFMDGSKSASEFVVPAGHGLLINDISWSASHGVTTFVPGRTLRLRLQSSSPDGSNSAALHLSSPVEITTTNNFGLLGGTDVLQSGALVGPGRIVCADVSNNHQGGFAANLLNQGILRGTLVPVSP